MPKVSEMTSASSLARTDYIPLAQGANTRKSDLGQFADFMASQSRWYSYASGTYTVLPASTSQITVTTTAGVSVGMAIRVNQGSGYLYGIITAVSSNASITFAGAALNTGIQYYRIGDRWTGDRHAIRFRRTWGVRGIHQYHGARDNRRAYRRWGLRRANCVEVRMTQRIADTSSQPSINIRFGGNRIVGSGTGIQLSATPGTWVSSGAAAMNSGNYDIDRDETIEVECTVVAGLGSRKICQFR